LQMSPPASPAFPDEGTPRDSSQGHLAAQANEASPVSPTSSLSEEAELRKAIGGLEAKVLTLQEQLTQLTFELLRERWERVSTASECAGSSSLTARHKVFLSARACGGR